MNQTLDERLTPIVAELIDSGITLEQAKVAFERKYLVVGFGKARKNQTLLGKMFGCHRNTIINLLKRHGLGR